MLTTISEAFQKLVFGPIWRNYARRKQRYLRFSTNDPSKIPLNVIIPIVSKDLVTVRYCIKGLRENLLHPVDGYYLVGPTDPDIISCCKELECNFVDEREILPEGPDYYTRYFSAKNHNRSSWMYQQFLKLSVGRCLEIENYLSVDADTVLINPFKYELGGKRIFDVSDGYRFDLHSSMKNLLPRIVWKGFSFMCHAMLFQTSLVNSLLSTIEQKTNRDWKTGIFESIDLEQQVCFSEFELYANYALQRANDNYRISYWFNKSLDFLPEDPYSTLRDRFGSRYRTLSFHTYNRNKRKI